MKRKVIANMRGRLDTQRFVLIPPGEIIDSTSILIGHQVPVHWDVVTEGLGYVMVDQDELESCSICI